MERENKKLKDENKKGVHSLRNVVNTFKKYFKLLSLICCNVKKFNQGRGLKRLFKEVNCLELTKKVDQNMGRRFSKNYKSWVFCFVGSWKYSFLNP